MKADNQKTFDHYMLLLGITKVPDFSEMKVSYKNQGFLSSELNIAVRKSGVTTTEEQREKLIDDFKNAIKNHGNLSNPKLTKILKINGNMPKLEGGELSPRALYKYIGLARCKLGMEAKSPEPQRGSRSGKSYSKEDIESAGNLYKNGNSLREISKYLGWSMSKVRCVLIASKVKIRSRSEGKLLVGIKIRNGKRGEE